MLDADIARLLATVFAAPPAGVPDVQALRDAAEAAPARLGGEPEPVAECRDLAVDGGVRGRVPLRAYRPFRHGALPALLYAHGGGWVTGSLDSHDRLCRQLANRSGALVVAVDYACAPEHRYPAALDDFHAAWTWLVRHGADLGADPARLAVGGDSSGGNLAAALALRLRALGAAQPAAQVLLYPALDAATRSASYTRFATGHNLSAAMMRWYWDAYAPQRRDDDPELAPLAARDLRGVPPAVVALAPADVLHDEGLAYAYRLAAAGVPVQTLTCTGMIHGFLRWTGAVPAAGRHLDAIGRTTATLLQPRL